MTVKIVLARISKKLYNPGDGFFSLLCKKLGILWGVFGLFYIGMPLFGVEVIPVEPSPEDKNISLRLIFPRPYENKRKTPINVQLRMEDFALGIMTPFSRAQELYSDPSGQTIHVIIDNRPYFTYNQAVGFTSEAYHHTGDRLLSFPIPFTLEPGIHVIRCFPAYSYGEGLKGKECFKAEIFYFQDKKRLDTLPFDLFKPYLTYNEPQGRYPAYKSDPILLDFYASNCTLSPQGYKVRLSIDGKEHSILTHAIPYYIKGLQSGKHKIKLELLDDKGELVSGYFNVVEREIFIEAPVSSTGL